MQRFALALATALVTLALAATSSHATLNACASAKKQCVSKKTAALLKCHVKAEKPPNGLDPVKFATCLQKAKDKFDGGTNPAKGCFAKLEAKFPGGCLSTGDAAALEAKVDAYVDDVICVLDPAAGTCPLIATPTPIPTSTPVPANCTNGQQDGGETDVDCGGSTCPLCPLGGGCAGSTDCAGNSVCSGGHCVCGPGQSNCDSSPLNGCEVTIASDPNNCGSCGSVCSTQNGTPTCSGSQCHVGSCNAGFSDCDNVVVTGCETNVQTDHSNCGFCGNLCGGSQTCLGAVCQ